MLFALPAGQISPNEPVARSGAIDAGGLLRGLGDRLEPIELTENRRQVQGWERDALVQLRDGNVDQALAAYEEHDRVHRASTAIEVRDDMASMWWAHTVSGSSAVMMTMRNSDADDLNGRARRYLERAGLVTGPTVMVQERPFQAGDHIVCLRNRRQLDIQNGTRGVIVAVDDTKRRITIQIPDRGDDAPAVTVPADYLDAGHIAHSYACNVWKTQGTTFDHGLLLGTDELFAQAGYVGFSRGRISNHLFLIGAAERHISTSHGPPKPDRDPGQLVTDALHRQVDQRLAIDAGTIIDLRDSDALAEHIGRLREVLAACPPDRSRDIRSFTGRRVELRDDLEPLIERHNELVGRTFKRAVVKAEIASLAGRIKTAHVSVVRVEAELANLTRVAAERERFLTDHRGDEQLLGELTGTLQRRMIERVDDLVAAPPAHLTGRLGPVPSGPAEQTVWRDAAVLIETYRTECHITDPIHPFGTNRGRPAPAPLELAAQLPVSHLSIELRFPVRTRSDDLGLGV